MRLFKHNTSLLPRRPYDIFESPFAKRRRQFKPREEVQIENSDELSNLSESESRDEKISEVTTSTPPLSSVHEQSLRMAALALEKKKQLIKMKKTEALLAMESKVSSST